jgi:hypothetical protein
MPAVSAPAFRPAELLAELGIFQGMARRAVDRLLGEIERRERAFEWFHMGTSSLPIGSLIRTLESLPEMRAPRTGHLGNWEDIVLGRAGTLDYNQVICCQWKLGQALVYDFNQTEDASLAQGDWVYLPGSLVREGKRTLLPLQTWDGGRFAERSREQPLFTPYVRTADGGGPVPLSRFHRRTLERLPGLPFRTYSDLILSREPLVREILRRLAAWAREQENPAQALELVFDRSVALDGVVRRGVLAVEGGGFRVGEGFYPDVDALVEAALVPIRAASRPESFFAEIAGMPWEVPLASSLLMEALTAILEAHYPEGGGGPETRKPCNVHLHWGAIGMAGYPPRRKGYFSGQVKHLRKLCRVLVDQIPEIDPIYFVLLPASPFMLLPSSAHPADAECLEALLDRVHAETDGLLGSGSHRLGPTIDSVVREWLDGEGERLSSYFLYRFSARRSVYNEVDLPETGEPLEPRGFRSLALRQATTVIGAIKQAVVEREGGQAEEGS